MRIPYQNLHQIFNLNNRAGIADNRVQAGEFKELLRNGCTSLPDNLTVSGHLDLSGCTSLTSLPDNLTVSGNLNLRGCTSLTSLPDWITQLGARPNRQTIVVILEGTGLSNEIIERLSRMDAPGMRFEYSMHDAISRGTTFQKLSDAIRFWEALLPQDHNSIPVVDELNENNCCIFLDRLIGTAEYKNANTRVSMAIRIQAIFISLEQNRELIELAEQIISDAIETCGDRVIMALDDLEYVTCLKSTI